MAGVLALGACAFFGMAPGPAFAAAGQGWEISCAYRMPSGIPGQGDAIVADYCARLRFCDSMAARGGADLTAMGCFGFEASRRR